MPPSQKHKDKNTVRTLETPSAYGSHSSMIVDLDNDAKNHNVPNDKVVCKDERGYYVTYKNRIDNNLADPCRYACPLCRFDNLNIVFSDWAILRR
jgi:2-iminoacetate synthase ThiH